MHVSSMAQNHSIQTEPTQQFSTHCGWTNSKTVLFTLLVLGITLGAGHHGFAQERRIYVPVSELDTILSQDKQGVVLPADEFDKLLEKAKQNDGSPAKLLVSNISYDAKIQGSQLLVDATVQFEQFEPGWHTLQLKTGGLAVESATLGKDQPPIGRTDSNNIYLLTNEPGEHSLKLSLSTPLASVGSDLVAAFSLPRSSAADFRIDFPAVKQLVVDGAAMNSVRTGNAVVRAEFAVGGRDKIELRITDQKRAQQSEATVFTTTAYGVNIAPSEITWQAVATLQSFGESLDKFVFSVPAALEIAAVESTGLESWTLADSANRKATEITLNFRQPVDGRRKITFRGVMAVPVNEQWSLPGLRLKNAASEIGRAIVRHPVGTRLVIESMAGIRRSIAANNSSQQQLSQAAFDIWQPDFNLELRLQLREREVLANMSTIVDVSENTVRFETLTAIECLNAPLFEVTATLPTDWEPTAILLNDKSVPWQMVPREPGRQYLRIPFPTALKPGGENNLTIRATQNLAADESGNSQFAIPQVGIDGAGVVEGVLLVRCQPFQRITPEELTGLDPTVLPNTKSEHPGFRYQEPEYSGTVRVTPKPTRLTAWTQSFTRLDPDRAITWLDLHIDASGGGLREFTVKLPESVGDRLRFSIVENCSPLVRIREQIATEVADGQRTWIIRFDRRIRGSLTLGGFLEEDRTEDGNRVPEAIVQNADRQYGFIATEASAEQHLTFNIDQQAGLQPVDAADLPPSTYRPDERIVAAYRYVKPGVNFTAMEERFDREAVPTAVCNSLKIQTIIGQAGQLRHRTAVDFVAVGVQNIRMLLPANTDLWSTELNGEPIEVRRDGNAYLIRLSPTEQPDTTQQLEVTYESEVDPLRTFGRLQQAAPTFSVEVSGIEQPIEVLARSWNVLHSSETVLDASSGLFEPKEDLGEQSPLAQIPNLLQLPNQRNATDKLTAIAAVVLIVLLPTLCFRRFGLPGLVGCAAVGLILMFAFSGILSTQTKQAKFAADAQVMPSPQTMSPYSAEMKPLNRVEDVPYDGRGRVTTSEELASPTRRSQEVAPNPFANNESAANAPAFGSRQLTVPGRGLQADQGRPSGGDRDAAMDLARLNEPESKSQPAPAKQSGARLSVPVEFEVPANYVATEFSYDGTADTRQPSALDIRYHGKSLNTVGPTAIALFVALLFWFSRSRGTGFRTLLILFGLLTPIALASLVPPIWQLVLEGVFYGTLAGLALWLLAALVNQIRKLPYSRAEMTTAAILLTVFAPNSAEAQSDGTEPTIIVPYDADGQPLDSGRVFIPQAEFLKLWRKANPDKAFANAPVAGLVSSATYTATLIEADDGNTAQMRIRGRFVLHSFRKQQISVALPISKVAIEKAEINGKPAPLRITNSPVPTPSTNRTRAQKVQQSNAIASPNKKLASTETLSVLLNEPGVSVLDVDFVVPVKTTGPAGRFQLPLKPTPSALMSFKPPADNLQVRVNGSSTAWRTGTDSDLQFSVSKGGSLTVEWQPKDEDSGVDRVVHTGVTTAAVIDDAGLHLTSKLDYRIRQGSISEITFKVPSAVILQKVVGTDVGGWQQNDDNDSRTVRVFLRRAVSESTSLTVQLFTQPKITDTVSPITIPDIRPTEVTREVGQVGIFSDPALVIRSGSVTGAAQIEPGEFGLPADFNLKDRKANLAYRYRVRPYAVSISVVRPSARLKAIAEHAVSIERRRIRYTTRFNLQSQGAPRGRFAVLLPDGFLPLEVFATNLTDWYPYKDESGADLLIVDLASPTLKPVELVVTGTLSRDPNELLATVPVPRMNDADTAASQIAIRIDKSYTSSISDSGSWHPISPNAVSTEVQNLAPSEIRFAFRSDELSPDPITIQLDQRSATLFGETVSVISLTDTSVEYSLNFKWIVRQSATDRLAFSGPDWLAGKLEVRCNGLRQVIESEPVDGRITWTLVLQEPVSSEHFALAVATFPPVTAGNLRTPLLRFEPGSNATNPIQVQTHYAVVLNQSERLITPVDPSLRGVQPDELQIKIPARYLDRATQILAVPGNAPPEWTVSTPERRTGAAATVNLADLRTVIAADGSYRTKAVYTIRNRSRQFLPLVLQDGMTVLSVFVKGTPARPVVTTRNEQQVHLIALPRTSEADLSFAVDIVVSGRIADQSVAKGLNIAGSEIQLAVPEVVSTSDDAEFGIPVAMTVWKVHVPKSWHARMIQTASNVTLQDEESSDVIRVMTSLKEAVDQSLSFSSKGDYRRGSYLNKQAAAYDNLKQVEQKIAADQSRVQNDEVASELRELRSNINQLQRQLADQGVQFNADASKAQLQQSQQTYDVSEDFVTNFNKDIAAGNGVSVAPKEQVQPKFRFQFQNADPFFSGAVPNTKSRGVQQQPATQRALQSSTRNRSSKKSFQNFNKQNYRVQVPEPSPSISFNGNTMSGEAVEPNAPTPDMFGDSPFAEPSSSMNVQGDIVLQPLDDLGAVVIKGNQANIDTVQGILEELGGAVAEKTWTQTGGLSLPIDLASDTVPLNFSKVGGTPELTLRVRPAGTMRKGYGLIWAAVWLGIAVAALFAYRRAGTDGLWSFVPTAVAFVGLVGFVLLTGSNATFAFAVFAVGVLLIGIRAAKRSDDQQHAST